MLDFLRSSTLGIGSNRRLDAIPSSCVALLPHTGPATVTVVGDVPEPFLVALTSAGLETGPRGCLTVIGSGVDLPTGVSPEVTQLWVGRAAPGLTDADFAVLARGGPSASVGPSGSRRALLLPFEVRAIAASGSRARARRVVERVGRRFLHTGVSGDPGERAMADGLFGVVERGSIDEVAATLVLPPGGDATALPDYVSSRLLAEGLAIEGRRWRLLADAEYGSQKLAWFVDAPNPLAGSGPEFVVKLARDPAFSPRLHNELAALRLLADAGIRRPGIPVPLMDVEVHGRALVAESGVNGVPFSVHGRNDPDDSVLARAFDELVAVTTAEPLRAVSSPDEARRDLQGLVDRFAAVYGPPAATGAHLAAHVDALTAQPLISTLQHGDPGTWNLLVDGDGAVAILDWENAEARGLPVADAVFFLVGVARRALEERGRRPTPDAIVGRLMGERRWRSWFLDGLTTAATATGADPALVPALAVMGAAYQAVKEVPRLDPAAPLRGEWVRLTMSLEGVIGNLNL